MKAKALVTAAVVVAGLGSGSAARAAGCGAPGAAWSQAAPTQVGLDAAKLQDALDFATLHSSETVLVIRHGCLAGSSRLDPVFGDQALDGWSMTKGVTALLAGRAVTLGKLDVDAPIGPLFPEADPAHAALTPRDLMTMSSGLHLTWLRDFNGTNLMPDRVRDALSLRFDHTPGSYWEYEQSPCTLLAEAITRAVGQDLQAFAQQELFGPIGIPAGSWTWERDRAGHTQGWAHLQMRSQDWARFGQLVLGHGSWNGTQLIDEAYIDDATTSSAANHAYGYFIWLNGQDSYVMPGVNGRDAGTGWIVPKAPADAIIFAGQDEQRVFTIPSLDMVVVRLGQKGSREADFRRSFWTSKAGELDNGLMRLIQLAVTDVAIQDPGPYEGSEFVMPSLEPDSFHGSAQDPLGVAGGFGLGPEAPAGCTPAGCE
jgi:CubicO group peptidase (beta-lactamase class C family)